jgi:hypothetical protein
MSYPIFFGRAGYGDSIYRHAIYTY